MKPYLLVCLLVFCVGANAGTVKWVDVKGNVDTLDTLPLPDFIVKGCQLVLSTMDQGGVGAQIPPRPLINSASRRIDPWSVLSGLVEGDRKAYLAFKTTLLEDATHGKVYAINSGSGLGSYWYVSEPKYEGRDKAVFMAKFNEKYYKIVIELGVFLTPEEEEAFSVGELPSWCPYEPQLAKVK